jgi:hypothetical protein
MSFGDKSSSLPSVFEWTTYVYAWGKHLHSKYLDLEDGGRMLL